MSINICWYFYLGNIYIYIMCILISIYDNPVLLSEVFVAEFNPSYRGGPHEGNTFGNSLSCRLLRILHLHGLLTSSAHNNR
jgi:hypothetical protein